MHIALHSDTTDLSVSQTEACGEIIIYSEAYWEGKLYKLGKYFILAGCVGLI